MDREVAFGRALEKTRQRAKEQGNRIGEDEVREIFSELSLERDQLALIHEYLEKHGIGVGKDADLESCLDDNDRNYLETYLRELERIERVSGGELEAVTISAMAGDTDAGRRLISLYLPQAADLAKLYAGQGVMMEDLIGEANLALAAGVEMLGALEHPSEAEGMLGRLMMEAMERCIAEHVRMHEIGKAAAERVNKVADAAKELSDALLRKVTAKELADESDIPLEEIEEALRLSAQKIEGIEDERGKS